MSAATMPITTENQAQPVEDDEYTSRTTGVELTRPYPKVVQASHGIGWLMSVVGIAQVVVGSLLFADWQIVGGFWVGFMAWGAGITGTCVSTSENSGGFPTALFFLQSAMSLIAAILSLVLIDGLAYSKVRRSDGNCFEVSSCMDNTCRSYDCVCWEPDGSTECRDGTSTRVCLSYNGDCDDIGDSESLLAASTVMHFIIISLACVAMATASATCCFCKYTVLLRREQGVTQMHRL